MPETTCGQCGAQRPADAAFCPACGGRVSAGGGAPISGVRPPPQPGPADLSHQLAMVLGDGYEVRGVVGRGGFAEVYEVFDRGLSRRLAVKVLRPDIAWTPGMLARFKEECRVLASLNHPNILPIHFVGEGQGLTWYVMPYVEGQSLGDHLRAFGALETGRALDIAVPILEALGHAHAAGMLHRDIKPDNVLIDQGSGRALLVDFGIAKRLDQEAGMTQTGFVVGTPQYMSPEQALGQAQLDARSDIYAFGAMLFQMVTGAPPYDGESSQEIVGKHIAEPVPQPTDRDARVPIWLSDVIVKCLAKRPVDRFQSVAQVLDAIRAGRARPAGPTITAEQVATRVSSGQLVPPRTEPPKSAGPLGAGPARSAGPPVPGPPAAGPPRLRVGVIAALLLVVAGGGIGWYLFGRPLVVPLVNRFEVPIRVVAPAGDTVTIAPGASARIAIPSSGFARLPWTAAARPGPDGQPMGQAPSGELSFRARRGQPAEPIGLAQTRAPMFEPLITNASSTPIDLIVNFGLGGAVRCDCTVPPGAVRQPIGYYPLFRNTTVRAVTASGTSATFRDLGSQVDGGFRIGLRFEDKDFR